MDDQMKNDIRQTAMSSNLKNKNVWFPMELIEYDSKYEKIMQFTFGGWAIAESFELATLIRDKHHIKCATLEGDLIQLGGVVSGAMHKVDASQSILKLMLSTKEISKIKALNEARLRKIIAQLETYNLKYNHMKTIEDSIQFKNYDLFQYKNRMCGDLEGFHKVTKEIDERLIINKER